MGRSGIDDSSGRLWVEEGDARVGMVAEVAPILRVHRTYTYAVPDEMADSIMVGRRVKVPVGRRGRLVDGFVVAVDRREWDSTLRPLHGFLDTAAYLTPDLIDLGREISAHYVCPLGRTLKAMTPEAVRQERGFKTVRYVQLVGEAEQARPATGRWSAQRQRIVDQLSQLSAPLQLDELLREADVSAAVVRGLARAGIVTVMERKEIAEGIAGSNEITDPGFELTGEQQSGVEQIARAMDAGAFCVTLLFGVSGSGKTEVYIRAIRRSVSRGGQAILLVPEIVLTTQLVQRLSSRLPDVAVAHSGLTEAQRSITWRQIASGERKVVIGTRSAVFAPCPNLGLICVDEEQETSYKNLQAPRFHVRDVAIMRAKLLGIPVVLGSATPSVETWYLSEHRADYQRVMMRRRVRDLPMPKVHQVDMRDEYAGLKRTVVASRSLERLLGEALDRGEQAVILMNRRGFANRLHCPACKSRITCPNCSAGLVVHAARGRSICHYCLTWVNTPTVCPDVSCGAKLVQLGAGTQRVEDVLLARFPKAKIRRVDSDTMRHREEYRQVVEDFENRRIDVLVGTQMIAKGLDFPFVSFVGVLHADAEGLGADFRAQERLFQLITQTAGRAGRDRTGGEVVVQTTTPDLPALRFALQHDYESFVTEELAGRRAAGLPPFTRLARIVVSEARAETARAEADALVQRIREVAEQGVEGFVDVLGSNPCVLSRLRGKYRYDLLIRTQSATSMRRLTAQLVAKDALRVKTATMVIDVDPVELR